MVEGNKFTIYLDDKNTEVDFSDNINYMVIDSDLDKGLDSVDEFKDKNYKIIRISNKNIVEGINKLAEAIAFGERYIMFYEFNEIDIHDFETANWVLHWIFSIMGQMRESTGSNNPNRIKLSINNNTEYTYSKLMFIVENRNIFNVDIELKGLNVNDFINVHDANWQSLMLMADEIKLSDKYSEGDLKDVLNEFIWAEKNIGLKYDYYPFKVKLSEKGGGKGRLNSIHKDKESSLFILRPNKPKS